MALERPQNAPTDNRLWHLMPPRADASVITVACHPTDFSASRLAHAVEDSNAHLLNLNVTAQVLDDGRLTVELRTNLPAASATVRSIERYGYEVIGVTSPEEFGRDDDDDLRQRAAELLRLLNV